MKEIQLPDGKITRVDDEDYGWLSRMTWKIKPKLHGYYVSSTSSRIGDMHRLIMGAKRGQQVDHIDHDTLNNTKINLRICTKSQNEMNKGLMITNTSGYKGVTWRVKLGKWEAYISAGKLRTTNPIGHIRHKSLHLGYYESPKLAALAYDDAAIKYFGEFALTNKMLGLL